MSRSGYSDDCGEDFNNQAEFYRHRVETALAGRRGQKFLKSLLVEMDKMPVKEIHASVWDDGCNVCALGVMGRARAVDMSKWDTEEGLAAPKASEAFDIAEPMAREIISENDGDFTYWINETPSQRFDRMRAWISSHIKAEAAQ